MGRWAHRTHLAGLLLLAAVPACREAGRAPPPASLAVTDDAGRPVALTAPARRVVSLLPSFTELLFAIGAGDRLVGRTTWCDYPPEAVRVPSVGDGMPPNVEAVAARHPDLVVLYRSGPNIMAAGQLERLGIKTVLLDLNLLEQLGPAARRLGVLTGRRASADSLARAMDSLASQPPIPSTWSLVFIVWDNPPIVIGAGSYLDRLAALAGRRREVRPPDSRGRRDARRRGAPRARERAAPGHRGLADCLAAAAPPRRAGVPRGRRARRLGRRAASAR